MANWRGFGQHQIHGDRRVTPRGHGYGIFPSFSVWVRTKDPIPIVASDHDYKRHRVSTPERGKSKTRALNSKLEAGFQPNLVGATGERAGFQNIKQVF